jgi:hypothetical protein
MQYRCEVTDSHSQWPGALCRGIVSVPSLGKPYVLRNSDWGSRFDVNVLAESTGKNGSLVADTQGVQYTCVADRTRRGCITQTPGTLQKEASATGKCKGAGEVQPALTVTGEQQLEKKKRKHDNLSRPSITSPVVTLKDIAVVAPEQRNDMKKKSRRQSTVSRWGTPHLRLLQL